jgi:hypothetical protein
MRETAAAVFAPPGAARLEIFAVQVLPGIHFPAVSGPYPEADGVPTIWSAPDASHLPLTNPWRG